MFFFIIFGLVLLTSELYCRHISLLLTIIMFLLLLLKGAYLVFFFSRFNLHFVDNYNYSDPYFYTAYVVMLWLCCGAMILVIRNQSTNPSVHHSTNTYSNTTPTTDLQPTPQKWWSPQSPHYKTKPPQTINQSINQSTNIWKKKLNHLSRHLQPIRQKWLSALTEYNYYNQPIVSQPIQNQKITSNTTTINTFIPDTVSR